MADIVWPASLPQVPRLAELERRIGRKVIRTEMDQGPAKIRRRFTFAPEVFPIALDLTPAQVATLVQFFDETSKGGSLAFDWKHPTLRTDATLRFLGEPVIKPRSTFASTQPMHLATFEVETVAPEVSTLIEPGSAVDYSDQAHRFDREDVAADEQAFDRRSPDGDDVDISAPGDEHWDAEASIIVNP